MSSTEKKYSKYKSAHLTAMIFPGLFNDHMYNCDVSYDIRKTVSFNPKPPLLGLLTLNCSVIYIYIYKKKGDTSKSALDKARNKRCKM